jgi:hypothetical protein
VKGGWDHYLGLSGCGPSFPRPAGRKTLVAINFTRRGEATNLRHTFSHKPDQRLRRGRTEMAVSACEFGPVSGECREDHPRDRGQLHRMPDGSRKNKRARAGPLKNISRCPMAIRNPHHDGARGLAQDAGPIRPENGRKMALLYDHLA